MISCLISGLTAKLTPCRSDVIQPGTSAAPAWQPAVKVQGRSRMAAIDQKGGPALAGSGAGIMAAVIAFASTQP